MEHNEGSSEKDLIKCPVASCYHRWFNYESAMLPSILRIFDTRNFMAN